MQEPVPSDAQKSVSPETQKNTSSATPNNSSPEISAPPPDSSADQATKPASAKGTTVIGCLYGPDREGKFELRSMSYRTGVGVMGPDDLKKGAGRKVKLTGAWKKDDVATGQSAKPARFFQATEVEVMSEVCKAPTEQTPLSKKKQWEQKEKQQEKQQQQKDAPPDASSPK